MVTFGIPKIAVIDTAVSWVTTISGYSSAVFDLVWLFGSTQVLGVAQSTPQTGWTTTTAFDWGVLGPSSWSLSVKNRSTLVVTEIATGSIFLETPDYAMLRRQRDAANEAIAKILEGGGNQSVSIKGRSTSKYGLQELKAIAKECESNMARLLQGGEFGQVLVRF